LLAGGAAPGPEALMRSRYTAFSLRDAEYLLASWHSRTRPAGVDFDLHREWTGLEIVAVTGGSPLAKDGTVEFAARYRNQAGPGVQRENSRFVRENGRWVYLGAVS
jgi:SEC-C motif-containing protein